MVSHALSSTAGCANEESVLKEQLTGPLEKVYSPHTQLTQPTFALLSLLCPRIVWLKWYD